MHVNTMCLENMNNLLNLAAQEFPKGIKPVSKTLGVLNIVSVRPMLEKRPKG